MPRDVETEARVAISRLDGGRVTAVLGPRIWFLGAPSMLGLLAWRPSPVLFIVALFAAPQLVKAGRYDPYALENVADNGISPGMKLEYTVKDLGVTGALAIMTYEVREMLASVR